MDAPPPAIDRGPETGSLDRATVPVTEFEPEPERPPEGRRSGKGTEDPGICAAWCWRAGPNSGAGWWPFCSRTAFITMPDNTSPKTSAAEVRAG